jgi:hypothetical protein
MIDIRNETIIRLEDVRAHLPSSRRGKYLSKAVAFRWASKGVSGVLLETVKVGGARYTSVEALQRFVDALNPAQQVGPPRGSIAAPTKSPCPAARQSAAQRAGTELTQLGV